MRSITHTGVAVAVAALALTVCAAVDDGSPSRNSISRVGTLHDARSAHTATTLLSGEVLITGGMTTGGGTLRSVELFNPDGNGIRQLGDLGESRAGHTATLLPDGRVLIIGGYNGQYLGSVEVFDPTDSRFRRAGTLIDARSEHTATLLENGLVLVVGGVGKGWTFLRTAELFDPASGRSSATESMSLPRESHTATLLQDGSVLITGGHSGRRDAMQVYETAELFVPDNGQFEMTGSLLIARHKHDAVALSDGRVLVVGGADRTDRVHYSSTEIYSPENGQFVSGPSMTHKRYKIARTSVLLPDHSVLIAAGAERAELLHVPTMTFREVAGHYPDALRFAATTRLHDGDVVVSGGYTDSNRSTDAVWRFRK